MIEVPENIGEVMVVATKGLGVSTATAHAIIGHAVGKSRSWILAHPEEPLSTEQVRLICNNLTWVRMGRPLAQVIGEREFCGLSFHITKDVLVPRPETEEFVHAILDWLDAQALDAPRLVDVGTGSGAIGVAVAVNRPDISVVAVDISPEALAVARRNVERHAVSHRVVCQQGDLLAGLSSDFHVIAANLPYIAADVLAELPVRRWEPRIALDGGPDGLTLLEQLIAQAPAYLASPGLLALEIGYDQGQAVRSLCQHAFPEADVTIKKDFAGQDRIVLVEHP
ncbi:MAG: peptide chain release factor N(5)-glutamine methyltransferase [Chloroflexi bacterium]|nr:peptide chain release factor N(5)-glutamine methyltransferase [Chloroflexota bacterium]